MIIESYKDIEGGYLGTTDITRLNRTIKMIKVVRNKDGEMIACAIYKGIQNSYKTTGIGSNGTKEGKEAVQAIIKDDIEPYQNWVWAEVSGAIEHLYKKYNGYPLPALYVSEVLPDAAVQDLKFFNEDQFHYSRTLNAGEEAARRKKVIFGFRNNAVATKVLKDVNYDSDRLYFNHSVTEGLDEDEVRSRYEDLSNAAIFVEQLGAFYDERGVEELTPGLSRDLDTCLKTIRASLGRTDLDFDVRELLEEACDLRSRMPMVVFRTIAEWKAMDKQ